jgi:hypothetical protein
LVQGRAYVSGRRLKRRHFIQAQHLPHVVIRQFDIQSLPSVSKMNLHRDTPQWYGLPFRSAGGAILRRGHKRLRPLSHSPGAGAVGG